MFKMNQTIIDYKNIKVFKGLNALRFFAAYLVLMHHSETIRHKNAIADFEWLGLFRNGSNAVTFFFVLSGFLITYLLLKESEKSNTIDIKKFYFKRVLRIWPLYFLLVFIGVIVLPIAFSIMNVNYDMPYTISETWYYFLFFLPGLVTFFFGHHFLEPLWSIGVEEMFYLIWAPLFKLSKSKIFRLLILVLIVKLVLNILGSYFFKDELFNYILSTFRFESMTIGGLGAYFLFTKGYQFTQLKIFNLKVQMIILFILSIYLLFHTNIDNNIWNAIFKNKFISPILIDLLFLYLILCVSVLENSLFRFDSKILSYLGEISYGIYMYHMLAVFSIILFLKKYLLQMNVFLGSIVFYFSVTILTILIASLSKKFFENYFLKIKNKLD